VELKDNYGDYTSEFDLAPLDAAVGAHAKCETGRQPRQVWEACRGSRQFPKQPGTVSRLEWGANLMTPGNLLM